MVERVMPAPFQLRDDRFPQSGGARRRTPRRAVAAAALVLAAAGCTFGDAAAPPPSSGPASSPTTQASDDPVTTSSSVPPGIEPIVDETPLPIDPDVRIGRLDNGLTYYVRSNAAPGNALAVRLAVDAGSLQQSEPTDQVAHFTEHMLFNGTTAYPGNTLDAELRALGAEIGPDLNAFTSFDETVYLLDVTLAGDNADTAFGVLREWAGNALIDPDEVAAERPVVREEHRLARERAGSSVQEKFDEVYLDGTPYEDRSPIGTDAAIAATTAEQLRAFYDRWYRPDLMAVIAVGDLPLDRMERLVTDTFSDLEARGDDHPPREEPEIPVADAAVADVVVDPGLDSTFISIDWQTMARNSGTFGGEQLDVWDGLITSMLLTRANEAISAGRSSLVRANGGPFSATRQLNYIGFNLDGPDLAGGTGEFLSLVATAARDGFSDGELSRAKAEVSTLVEQEVAQLSTRQDAEWADAYFQHFLAGVDISAPSERRERLQGLLEETSSEDLNGYLRWIMETAAPLVVVVGPDESSVPDQTELAEVVRSAVAIDDVAGEVAEIDALLDPPDPVEPISTRDLPATGGVEWTFDNGARVVFAESNIAAGLVDIVGFSDGGWSVLPADDQPLLELATDMVDGSGLADLDRVSVDRYLADKVVAVGPFSTESIDGVSGQASPGDLEIAFQLLHLYASDPRVDDPAFNRVVVQAEERLRAVQNQPEAAADEALESALSTNPERNPNLGRAALDRLTPELALELYTQRFVGVDDLVLSVVGDVDAATVRDLAARYVGTLPSRPDDSFRDLLDDPAAGVVTVERTAGPAGGSGVLNLLYSVEGSVSDVDRVHEEVLQSVLDERLFTRIREELGASYSGGSAFVYSATEPDERTSLYISVAGDPDRLDEIRDTVLSDLADLDANGPTADEFQRARAVVIDRYSFISNDGIIRQLMEEATEDGPVLTNGAALDILDRTTRGDVAATARDVIDTESWIEVFVTPAG